MNGQRLSMSACLLPLELEKLQYAQRFQYADSDCYLVPKSAAFARCDIASLSASARSRAREQSRSAFITTSPGESIAAGGSPAADDPSIGSAVGTPAPRVALAA